MITLLPWVLEMIRLSQILQPGRPVTISKLEFMTVQRNLKKKNVTLKRKFWNLKRNVWRQLLGRWRKGFQTGILRSVKQLTLVLELALSFLWESSSSASWALSWFRNLNKGEDEMFMLML